MEEELSIPNRFECTQKMLAIKFDLYLSQGGRTFGKVVQKFSMILRYELVDASDRVVAVAEKEAFKSNYFITTSEGNLIAKF